MQGNGEAGKGLSGLKAPTITITITVASTVTCTMTMNSTVTITRIQGSGLRVVGFRPSAFE